MATEVHSYRVGNDIHKTLRRLAEVHGSVDKALRLALSAGGVFETGKALAQPTGEAVKSVVAERPVKSPLLKPSERKGK